MFLNLTEELVPIHIKNLGLVTFVDGKPNPTAKLMISILGTISEMERIQIRERQAEGIAVAKAQGKFLGRKPGSNESKDKFLAKPKNRKIAEYLAKTPTYTVREIASIVGCSTKTVQKVKGALG